MQLLISKKGIILVENYRPVSVLLTVSKVFEKLMQKQQNHLSADSYHSYYVGNKAKGRTSKRVFQENKARQFSEKRAFLTP